MKITKLPSGSYHTILFSHMENGKRKYISLTSKDRNELLRMIADYKSEKETMQAGSLTVRTAMQQYIDARRNVLSPSTVQGYEKILKHNLQGIMNIPLNKLTQLDVQIEIDRMSARLAPKTVANAHGFLAAVLKSYRPAFILRTSLPQVKIKFKDLPSPDSIFSIVRGTKIELPVLLAMWLSLSMSEIRGIRKSTDIRGNVLTLNRSIVDIGGKPVEKSAMKEENRSRRLVIPTYILKLIEQTQDDYIVTGTAHAIGSRWKRLQEKAGADPVITFHDLRHVNASVMLLLGVPDRYAMERGGWKTPHTMKAVYQNTFSKERVKFDHVIDDYFENIVNAK